MVLLGISLLLIQKNLKDKPIAPHLKALGFGLLFASIFTIPLVIQDTILKIKEEGIIEYLTGEVEVIQHSDSTYTFWWSDWD